MLAPAGEPLPLAARFCTRKVTTTDRQSHVVRSTIYNTLFPLTGTVPEETVSVGATVLSDTVNSYATLPAVPVKGAPTFVYLRTATAAGHEADGTALPSTTTTNTDPPTVADVNIMKHYPDAFGLVFSRDGTYYFGRTK